MFGGSVMVDYSGTRKSLRCSLELWQKGAEKFSTAKETFIEENYEGEISISISDDEQNEKDELPMLKFVLNRSSSNSSSSSGVVFPKFQDCKYYSQKIVGNTEIYANNEVVVFALIADKEPIKNYELEIVESMIKKYGWILILKIAIEEVCN